MAGYFWNTILAVNSVLWFFALAFATYGLGMLIFRGDWKFFLFSFATLIAITLTELVLTGLAHD